jgi:hypothetical protein
MATKRYYQQDQHEALAYVEKNYNNDIIDLFICTRTADIYYNAHRLALRLQNVKTIKDVEVFQLEKTKEIITNLLDLIKEEKK